MSMSYRSHICSTGRSTLGNRKISLGRAPFGNMIGCQMLSRSIGWRSLLWFVVLIPLLLTSQQGRTAQSIATYHYDDMRTGWNSQETKLAPGNVGTLKLVATASVDEQVDAQPLLVPAVTIAGGTHDVVYIATENNTIFAIDAATGAVLISRNLGTAVSQANLPGKCGSNSAVVGIGSTPAIDPTSKTIFVMAYTLNSASQPSYVLHALDWHTLADKLTPRTVSASATLNNGTSYNFNPSVSRQRAALLEMNGSI